MTTTRTIGIDLGGTNIKAGIVNAEGTLIRQTSIETEGSLGFEHVFQRIVGLVNELRAAPDGNVTAVGIGVPGPMSHERGFIYGAPNLPGWVNIPLRDLLTKAVGLRVSLENDANAAAYGEFVAGAGKNSRDMVMLTLGTGVGGGIIAGRVMMRGHFDNAGEVGHMIIWPGGRKCPCGQSGCLERYASANAIVERAVEKINTGRSSSLVPLIASGGPTAIDVLAAAVANDVVAAEVWFEACQALAIACVNLQHTLNPERIVLAGGLTNAGQQLLAEVRGLFADLTWRVAPDQPTIDLAQLSGTAGIIGAAALAHFA